MEVKRTEEEPHRRKSLFAGLPNAETPDIVLEVASSNPTATALARGTTQASETLRTPPRNDSLLESRPIDRRLSQPEQPYPPRRKVSALDIDAQKEYADDQRWEEVRRGGGGGGGGGGFLPSFMCKKVERRSGRLVSRCLAREMSYKTMGSWNTAATDNSSRLSN